jgi:hypothetical protein
MQRHQKLRLRVRLRTVGWHQRQTAARLRGLQGYPGVLAAGVGRVVTDRREILHHVSPFAFQG